MTHYTENEIEGILKDQIESVQPSQKLLSKISEDLKKERQHIIVTLERPSRYIQQREHQAINRLSRHSSESFFSTITSFMQNMKYVIPAAVVVIALAAVFGYNELHTTSVPATVSQIATPSFQATGNPDDIVNELYTSADESQAIATSDDTADQRDITSDTQDLTIINSTPYDQVQ